MFYDDIDWYCDSCNAYLNNQSGFSSNCGSWECKKCGYINDIKEENIISEDEVDFFGNPQCPDCGGNLARMTYSGSFNKLQCESCGHTFEEDDTGLSSID